MSKEEIIEILIAGAARIFKADAATITADTVIDDLGTKSLQRVGLLATIENETEVVIPITEFGKFKTLSDLADRVLEEL